MNPDVQIILEAAIHAPSGENVQPWRFHIEGDSIQQHHANVDSEIYDTGNRGSYISHGAALENVSLKASELGYATEIQLFPDSSNQNHIATISLRKDTIPTTSTLAGAIENRVTNRNKYKITPLNDKAVKAIHDAISEVNDVEYIRITDRENIQKLARVGSVNEEVMLQNETLHNFFFDHVTWTKEEDEKKRVGFYIKTLGLPAPIQALFTQLKKKSVMQFMKKLNFPAVVGKGNAATYASSAEIGILTIPQDTPRDFIQSGRALQRIWLAATNENVALQPLAGTLFMRFYIRDDQNTSSVFASNESALIAESVKTAEDIAGKNKTIAFMFRLGYSNPPEAHSSRFPLEHFMI